MGRFGPPRLRQETPFLVDARNGNAHQNYLLRISLGHRIIDISQAKDYDPESIIHQLEKTLTPEQLATAIRSLATEEGDSLDVLLYNPRVVEWMPGGQKSRCGRNK